MVVLGIRSECLFSKDWWRHSLFLKTGAVFSPWLLQPEELWICYVNWTLNIFYEFLALLYLNGTEFFSMIWGRLFILVEEEGGWFSYASMIYVGSSFCVVFDAGLWAMQPELVHCSSPFPAFNLLCKLWSSRKPVLSPLLSSGVLKEQPVLAVACTFVLLMLLLPQHLQFVWLVGGCWRENLSSKESMGPKQ